MKVLFALLSCAGVLACDSPTTVTKHKVNQMFMLPEETPIPPEATIVPMPTISPEPTVIPSPLPRIGEGLEWDYNSQAIAAGQGCRSKGDNINAFFIAAGNDFSMVINDFGIKLSDSGVDLSARSTCTVRIPVRIAEGYALSAMSQSILYSVNKSTQASGSISLRAVVGDLPAAAATTSFDYGSFINNSAQVLQASSIAPLRSGACVSSETMYALNLAMLGKRDSSSDVLEILLDNGQSIALSGTVSTELCL